MLPVDNHTGSSEGAQSGDAGCVAKFTVRMDDDEGGLV
jgi:hypothetical protein